MACAAPIPAGALFCGRCGADAPTEIGADNLTPTGQEADDPVAQEARRQALRESLGSNFEVMRLVGRGGFGEVWAAFDLELNRSVAIKVLRAELIATPGFRERFRREARAVAKLRHPGIVPIYHVGEAPGLVYFIMPLVEGVTLKAALEQQGRLAPEEALRILIEASSALREAHRRGIVHRDLKPENVMLEGPERHVLLMDFGIAQSEDQQEDKELTGAGMVLGSPEYMSPEQATGKRGLDGRSDIYSLGVVAYRMLSGRLPFDAETARELLVKHVTTPPDPLENVPPALAYAVMRCLAKLPDERWQSTDEFVNALENDHLSITQSAPAALVRARRRTANELARVRRRPLVATLAVVGLVVLGLLARQLFRSMESHRRLRVRDAMVRAYQATADTLRGATRRFAAGSLGGQAFLVEQERLTRGVDQRLSQQYGTVEDYLASLSDSARQPVDNAMDNLWLAGLYGIRLAPRPSESRRCLLEPQNHGVRLRDDEPLANCWYGLTPTPAAVAFPAEYYLTFRLPAPEGPSAGIGLAWCAGAATCRVAFLWPGSRFEWGALRTGANLQTVHLGRRLPSLGTGLHQLRVRYQNDLLKVWLDSTQILETPSPDDAAFLAAPGDLRVVVQNTAIEIPSSDGIGVVGGRRP